MSRKKYYTSDEIIDYLVNLRGSRNHMERKVQSKFTYDELVFIKDLVFHKPYKYLPIALAEFLENNFFNGMKLINSATLRRLSFFRNLIIHKGNATKVAILAGYSPKSAKQQGYRILRWIQNECKKGEK